MGQGPEDNNTGALLHLQIKSQSNWSIPGSLRTASPTCSRLQSGASLVRRRNLSLKLVPATTCLWTSMTSSRVRWSHWPVTPDTPVNRPLVARAASNLVSPVRPSLRGRGYDPEYEMTEPTDYPSFTGSTRGQIVSVWYSVLLHFVVCTS